MNHQWKCANWKMCQDRFSFHGPLFWVLLITEYLNFPLTIPQRIQTFKCLHTIIITVLMWNIEPRFHFCRWIGTTNPRFLEQASVKLNIHNTVEASSECLWMSRIAWHFHKGLTRYSIVWVVFSILGCSFLYLYYIIMLVIHTNCIFVGFLRCSQLVNITSYYTVLRSSSSWN